MVNYKILVLGGTKFVGYKIVQYLLRDGCDVTILNRGTKGYVFGDKVRYIICDRKNINMMQESLKDQEFDYVIDVSGMDQSMVQAAYGAISKEKIKKYIFISSSAVYFKNNNPMKEDDELGFNDTWKEYGTNKIAAEHFLITKYQQEQFPVVILRPPYIYGEGNNIYREGFVFDRLIEGKIIVVPGEGETRIQFIHIEDLYNVIKIMLFNDVKGEYFNVGNEGSITFLEWIEACEAASGKELKKVFFNYKNSKYDCRDFFPFHDYEYYLSVDKMKEFYNCSIPLMDGLKRDFEYYIQYGGIDNKKAKYELNINKILEEKRMGGGL